MRRVLIPPAIDAVSFATRAHAAPVERLTGATMGTTWSVALCRLPGVSLDKLRAGIGEVLAGIVAEMSHWQPGSDLDQFNNAPAGTWHSLPPDFFAVLHYALGLAEASGGAYDPTIGALVDLWGFGPEPRSGVPSCEFEICRARAASGWHRVVLDPARRRACQPGGLRLDLSSVAKGFAVDRVSAWLAAEGVAAALVEIGGELRGFGVRPDGMPWWVAIEPPPATEAHPRALIATVLALHDVAVATSGDYRRFYQMGGRRIAHTIDPRTGYPTDNVLASVTVVHPSCMQADALSTLLTVLGPECGPRYAARHGLAALFIRREPCGRYQETLTPALAAMLE
jgi:thiamine biosynthesis lipoprotein